MLLITHILPVISASFFLIFESLFGANKCFLSAYERKIMMMFFEINCFTALKQRVKIEEA